MSDQIVDISVPVKAICDLVGIDHYSTQLLELRVEPFTLTAIVLKRNKAGSHYRERDGIASETLTFKVWT